MNNVYWFFFNIPQQFKFYLPSILFITPFFFQRGVFYDWLQAAPKPNFYSRRRLNKLAITKIVFPKTVEKENKEIES